jgi:hypothetical protein
MRPKIVQERLSHDDISVMLNRYRDISASVPRQAPNTIEVAIADAMKRVG